MSQRVIIDGNNLLHAMHEHAPLPHVGRETMAQLIGRWARRQDCRVTLVYDGPAPPSGLAKQMALRCVDVRFSAPRTADDVIVDLMSKPQNAQIVRVISGDKAVGHEARLRRLRHTTCIDFIGELFAAKPPQPKREPSTSEKPASLTPEEVEEWMDIFEGNGDGET